jgi:sugar O-acyltransferase (sialic acid O-acetyltransferase NeuD family)
MTSPSFSAYALRIVVVGAGGLGRCVAQYLEDARAAGAPEQFAGFLDDRTNASTQRPRDGLAIVGTPDQPPTGAVDRSIVAVASPEARRQLAERVAAAGGRFQSFVHPRAYVAPSARLGIGCVVGPLAFIGPYAELGEHVFVNAHAFVDHDTRIGPFSYLAPHSVIGGHATLGERVFLEPHALVEHGVHVPTCMRVRAGHER